MRIFRICSACGRMQSASGGRGGMPCKGCTEKAWEEKRRLRKAEGEDEAEEDAESEEGVGLASPVDSDGRRGGQTS